MKRSLVYGSLAVALVASVGMAQSVTIDNGVVGDGHLRIDIDGYGGYSNWGWAANLDYYDPAGALAESNPMFAGSFMFYSGGVEKVCFAEPFFDIDNTYNLRAGTFDLPTPSNPVVNIAGDEATSSWTSTNLVGDISLDFTLVQTVAAGAGSVATLTQVLTVTNRSAAAVNGTLQRHLDVDLLWDASAEDVAGSVDCAGTIIPYMREPDGNRNSETLLSLTSPDAHDYVSSKSGFTGGTATPMAFGTDFQIWDNFGYPTDPGGTWRNYTAGIGHAPLAGELPGAQPLGSITPFDAFINIEWAVNLAPGASQTVTAVTVYGTDCTAGGGCPPCACEFDTSTGPNICDIFDFLGFQGGFVGGDPCAIDLDLSTGPGVGDIFDFLAFQSSFVGGPCP